jgi:hypothetical protein
VGSAIVGSAAPTAPDAGAAGDGPPAPADDRPGGRPVHRWRDLDRAGRLWALAAAAAVLLGPILAFAHFIPDWAPQGDPALMALRALDTGTSRTPVLGQPSQSLQYAGRVAPVHHPGPVHFYLLAVPVRVLGGWLGMSLVSVAIVATCLVTSAWAVFRQLGRTGGLVAALALAAVTFTTGAASMINPVSSSIAGYPLLATAVLMWCVACGDVRLLPAAAAAASFTAQQHLSVVPAAAVLVVGGLALGAFGWWRQGRGRDPGERAELARWGAGAAVVALVLWAPVLAQQFFGGRGNLSEMLWFVRNGGHETLGLASAARQVAHTLGLPPLLGRTEVSGFDLIGPPSSLTWVSAAAVTVAVVAVCLRWRRGAPRRASLGPMIAVVVAAGLVNGSSVPEGLEQGRITFYHWTWVLAFFVALVLGLAVTGWCRRVLAAARPAAVPALAALAVVAVAVPAVVSVRLDRRPNTTSAAYSSLGRDVIDELADAGADRAGQLGDHLVVVSREEPPFALFRETLAFALTERGVDVRMPLNARFFVHEQRLVDRDELDGGLVLVVDRALPSEAPDGGELIAHVALTSDSPGIDVASYRALVEVAEPADRLRLGPAIARDLSDGEEAVLTAVLQGLVDRPADALLRPEVLAFLADNPPLVEPALDPALAGRLLASVEAAGDDWSPDDPTALRLFVVDRDEMLALGTRRELGRPVDG